MEQATEGYPVIVFYICAVIGILLVLYRPKNAFYFIVLCLTMRHFHLALKTRTPVFREFLNLNDLFLWIGIAAVIANGIQNKKVWFPNIVIALMAIVCLGTFHTIFLYGFHYECLREIWGAWIFPLMFLVSANFVKTNEDAKKFIWVFFIGAFLAAVQHIIEIKITLWKVENITGLEGIREISYMFSGGIFLLIGTFFIDIRQIFQKKLLYYIYTIGISVIGISYLLSFTRTLWLGVILSTLTLFIYLYRDKRKILLRFSVVLVFMMFFFLTYNLISHQILREAEVEQLIEERAEFIFYEDSFQEAYGSREAAIRSELKFWLEGPILWGLGAAYPPQVTEVDHAEQKYSRYGALNHVAFSSYLAHYGLIGLFLYGFLLPFSALKRGRQLYLRYPHNYVGIVAIVGVALALYNLFTLGGSFHLLTPTTHAQGLLYGALWGLSGIFGARQPVAVPTRREFSFYGTSWPSRAVNP